MLQSQLIMTFYNVGIAFQAKKLKRNQQEQRSKGFFLPTRKSNQLFLPFLGTTISYVAPELLKGDIVKFTKTCDIYAMGISIFEVLSDKASPWDEFNLPIEILKSKIESGLRPDLQALQPLYEDSASLNNISKVIEKCWQDTDRPDAFQVNL